METMVIALVVIAAAVYLTRRFWRGLQETNCADCPGCDAGGCPGAKMSCGCGAKKNKRTGCGCAKHN